MIADRFTEEEKRAAVRWTAYVGWSGAFVLSVLRIVNMVPIHFGALIVLLIGVAIAAGLSMSRYKLTETIIAAFRAGYDLSHDTAQRKIEDKEEHHK